MYEFPSFLKVKRYRKNPKATNPPSWVIDPTSTFIKSEYVISFHPWKGSKQPRKNPDWVIKWHGPDCKRPKFYLLNDSQYKGYFKQYQKLKDPNSVDYLVV